MSHDNTAHLVFRHASVHDQREAQQHPWQVWGSEHKQTQEAEHRVWVLPTPDVDQRTRQRRAQEGHGQHGRHAEQRCRREGEEP
jgi:hypothetical protein